MAELAILINKRGNIKGRLTRISNTVREFKEGDNINQLKMRMPNLEPLLSEFIDIQLQIEDLDQASSESDDQKCFEKMYFDTLSEMQTKIEAHTSSAHNSTGSGASTSNSKSNVQNFKLPTLALQTFTGLYSEWNSFYDTFNSLIHNNADLNDCERFHYLKSCLKCEPLHAVESLPVSDANYASAWQILRRRYENKRLIVQEHVLAIINSPIMHKPSHTVLRQFLDKVTSNIEALKVLKLPVESWDALIVPIIAEKLDYITKRDWQTKLDSEIPKLTDLIKLLEKRLEILYASDIPERQIQQQPNKGFPVANKTKYIPQVNRQVAYMTTNQNNCIQCKKSSHRLFKCSQFLNLTVRERAAQVEANNLCKICLNSTHVTADCRSNRVCDVCKQKHNSLLHDQSNVEMSRQMINPESAISISNHCMYSKSSLNTVLLSTALINIKDCTGNFQECRALLDVGSQSSFITSPLCKKLGLRTTRVNIPVAGINQATMTINQTVKVTIKSRMHDFSANITCLVTPKISENIPIQSFSKEYVEIPSNIFLADPQFNKSKEIDILIGAEMFWELLCVGQIQKGRQQPTFQKTHFGWIIGGTIKLDANRSATSCNVAVNNLKPLEDSLTKFWEIEQYPTQRNLSLEERNCESFFTKTLERNKNGRFVVKLPFAAETSDLGTSYDGALKRFYSLERRLTKNPVLKNQYSEFITEYLNLNHMQLVTTDVNTVNYYLPHHAVFKKSTGATKLRVVFDASFKTSNGISLNDNLMCGPVIQEDLFSILTRFRTFQYVLNGDITKMYRQILIHKDHVDYQRILWRDHPQQKIQIYQLLTLTYGTKPASFIATRCLKELALQNEQRFQRSSNIIRRDFYMDDLLTGANSIKELINIKNEVTAILAGGGFELRKFASNCKQVLADVATDCTDMNTVIDLDKNGDTKTLGLLWNCHYDILKYQVKLGALPSKITKRTMLSVIAQIFDPLGLLGPVTMRAKIILQQLWTLKLNWDESVPLNVYSSWKEFLEQLEYLNDLKISRRVITVFPVTSIELHGFCDASRLGYGAAIYVKSTDPDGNQSCSLLCAKSRVAPLKTVSIPRLELCAALLLSKLFKSITETSNLTFSKYALWTDSTIVLAWLASCPSTLNTFVANRVAEIQSIAPSNNWYHIKSEGNPADIISRGQLPQELIASKFWFHGPSWLREGTYNFQNSKLNTENIEISEKRNVMLSTNPISEELPLFTKYSKFSKLQHVTALCLRFIHNCKNKVNKISGKFSLGELQTATKVLIINIQQREFSSDIKKLRQGQQLDRQSKIISLNPFMDKDGLLRVGGRLRQASIGMDKKYPTLLPKGHHITKLIISQEHERQLHAGAQATLAAIRQNYWIISARSIIRHVLHKCVQCFRVNPRTVVQKMGDLPEQRLRLTRPFLTTGVDYAGPILIKDGRGRGKKTTKAYIALFICFSTKAVHLELVGDLSTESFLNALKRFVARRGCISSMYSDNATNFVGAKRELEELAALFKDTKFQKDLNTVLEPLKIVWKFIPPRSPNMGGLWEVNVKCVKFHLRRILGNALLCYEEMYTLLTLIEACLNSRPLTPLTSDPNDLVALTPGHFLIGEPLTAWVEPNFTETKTNRLSRWQYVEQVRQHFWKRWYREYLVQMQGRSKWQQTAKQSIDIGTMVLLVEDGNPPQQWPLGRIVDIHPGADSIVRVVTVKTVRGLFKRAVNRVCVLPISE